LTFVKANWLRQVVGVSSGDLLRDAPEMRVYLDRQHSGVETVAVSDAGYTGLI
jgi:hypothetical protein